MSEKMMITREMSFNNAAEYFQHDGSVYGVLEAATSQGWIICKKDGTKNLQIYEAAKLASTDSNLIYLIKIEEEDEEEDEEDENDDEDESECDEDDDYSEDEEEEEDDDEQEDEKPKYTEQEIQAALRNIGKLTDTAYAKIKEAEAIADEYGLQFSFSVSYGMGGSYEGKGFKWEEEDDPRDEGEWIASSNSC